MQWLFESFIFCSSFSSLVFIVPDFGRKYPDGEEFLRKCWGCLGVRGGFWVEGGWRGSKGGGCESSANKLADRLWISIYTAFAGCDVAGKDRGPLPDGISIHTAFAGCDSTTTTLRSVFVISIHTAFAGCDLSP